MSIKDKLKQYGIRNFIGRGIKSIGRKLGFRYERYILIVRDLNGFVEKPTPKIQLDIRELNYENFISNNSLKFSPNKFRLFKKRFSSGNYIALGAYHEGNLVYSCWISLNNFESSLNLGNKLRLSPHEGLLVDAYTHPKFRGLGIHTYMSAIRANKLLELNKRRAIGLVLMENLPARKAQAKIGFKGEKIILYIKIFNREIVKIKNKKIEL